MKGELRGNYVICKIFNNNVVLAKNEGKEKIIFDKGIGFGKKFGDVIKKGTLVDKIFTIEDQLNLKNFNEIVNKNDKEFLGLCEEIIYDISEKLNEELSENIHVGLIEHISFAIKRLSNSEEIQNPFLVEIQTLYPEEFALAREAALKIEENTGILMPDGEIGFIALHIHSARNNGKLSNTIKYSYIGNRITEYVEEALNIKIDKKSLDYARFLTHMRFAIERIMKKSLIKNDLLYIIKSNYKKSYIVAEQVAIILEEELDVDVVEDEVAYIAMHIERFRISIENN